ncbi:hypothetical protein PG997_009094 [Apiospora hydei]|uniref:Uncharacterized protein n=1 Tax=Apiospora hydei TaxID=1337664 RepID=A0ABR1VT40_9PEZI
MSPITAFQCAKDLGLWLGALVLIDACARPLFVARSSNIQTMYTTVLFTPSYSSPLYSGSDSAPSSSSTRPGPWSSEGGSCGGPSSCTCVSSWPTCRGWSSTGSGPGSASTSSPACHPAAPGPPARAQQAARVLVGREAVRRDEQEPVPAGRQRPPGEDALGGHVRENLAADQDRKQPRVVARLESHHDVLERNHGLERHHGGCKRRRVNDGDVLLEPTLTATGRRFYSVP